MSLPYDIKNTAMTGSIIDVALEPDWNSVVVKMREDNVDLLVYDAVGTNYITVPSGTSMTISSHNYSGGNSTDYVRLKAASGTAEILGHKRD